MELFALGIPLVLFLVILTIALAVFAFWLWMLIDAAQYEDGAGKVAWVLIILFLHFLGAVVYFFVRKGSNR